MIDRNNEFSPLVFGSVRFLLKRIICFDKEYHVLPCLSIKILRRSVLKDGGSCIVIDGFVPSEMSGLLLQYAVACAIIEANRKGSSIPVTDHILYIQKRSAESYDKYGGRDSKNQSV